MEELSKHPSQRMYKEYFDLLPTNFEDNPFFYDDKDLEELRQEGQAL